MSNSNQAFLSLIRAGIGCSISDFPQDIDWDIIEYHSAQHGLLPIIVDGIETLSMDQKPPKQVLLQWIGEVLQSESSYFIQREAAGEMALLFHHDAIRTYVLKGGVVAECYPNPIHRNSVDLDCFLRPEFSDCDAWELGNALARSNGYEVSTDFYKNSTFSFAGLMVENHKFITPFRGNKRLKALEKVLQALLLKDKGEDKIEGTWLYRPPVIVSALFLVEHAYSHFLHEGLTWRLVLDWMMFSEKHKNDIDWTEFEAYIDKFGFRKFYNAYLRLGYYLLGIISEDELSKNEQRMLADIWAPLDLHDEYHGIKGKLDLAGNTIRAGWKYRYFTEISWVTALWIQVKGFLFIKHPALD